MRIETKGCNGREIAEIREEKSLQATPASTQSTPIAEPPDSPAPPDALGLLLKDACNSIRGKVQEQLRKSPVNMTADDALNHCTQKFYETAEGFRGKEPAELRAWLMTVARNWIFDQVRRELSFQSKHEDLVEKAERERQKAKALSPRHEAVRKAMARLRSDYRIVLLLRSMLHVPWPKTSFIMAKGTGACQMLHNRAYVQLQENLQRVLQEQQAAQEAAEAVAT